MLFVDDDERKIGHRRENRRARADHHARFSALDAMPLLGAFAVGQSRVEDSDFVSEDLMQVGGNNGSEADLRYKQNRRSASFEHGTHTGQIDCGLPRAGNAVEQRAGESAGVDVFTQARECGLLCRIEVEAERR